MLSLASRRVVLGALAVVCVTCQTQVTPPPSHAEADGPPAGAAREPADLRAELAAVEPESAIGRARACLDGSDLEGARRIAESGIAACSPADRGVLHWIAARAAERAGDVAGARAEYEAIEGDHPLARWAALARARMLVESTPADAVAIADPLAAAEWTGRAEARAVAAIARARAGTEDAEGALRGAIEADGPMRAELERALAELLAAREDGAARGEAVTLLRWIEARGPGSRAGREALARAEEIRATLPEEAREALALPTLEQQIARAEALAAAMDHAGAEEAYRTLLPRLPEDDHARRCDARLGQGRAMYRRRARREAVTVLAATAEDCRDRADVRAWARYFAGKSYSGLDRHPEAIAQYDVLAEEQPDHRLADDALVTAARLAADDGDGAGMRDRLERAIAIPGGDMRGEARFLLAWSARSEGRLEDALAELDRSIAEGAQEQAEDVRGRAAYWRARVLEQLGRRDEAIEQYASVIREVALSYYAQHAYARLARLDRARADRAMPDRAALSSRSSFTLADSPSARTAIALLRAGEASLAERELEAAGVEGWARAALFDRAGAYTRSTELVRRTMRAELDHASAIDRWRLGYPRAFHPLIETTAEAEGVPAAFVRAIAREESSFRPDAVSVAHAYGLLQIIRPTAQRVGRPLGLPSDPASLRRPEVNVRIGVRYMAGLQQRYGGNAALIPAAYNAGEGAVDRWIREAPDRALDEFVEEIPYDETRRYSRRVLQTWGIYAWLDEGALPSWPETLPVR